MNFLRGGGGKLESGGRGGEALAVLVMDDEENKF
jgi:hypothetical protein